MPSANGWYCKMKTPKDDPQVRWIVIENYHLLFYENKADKDPVNVFHVDGLTISNAFGEIDQYHSIKVNVSHTCEITFFYIITPNQFDIKAISGSITEAQKNWKSFNNLNSTAENKFTVDELGKFIFRAADRMALTVLPDKITVAYKDGKVNTMLINQQFDCYPLNANGKDYKWIIFKYSEQDPKEYRAHCENLDKMLSMTNLILKYKSQKK